MIGALSEDVYAVGGVVRDALLGRVAGPDVDLVVVGDPTPVAVSVARRVGGRIESHPRFLAASVVMAGDRRLDLVGARVETYASPGALPDVRPASLAEDLARRDFTVNAMALTLRGPSAGELRDPTGGVADLEQGVLRLLRPDGFAEDPSRLVRGARYAARLGLRPAADTERAARSAGPRLDPSSARVVDELERLAWEDDAAAASGALAEWGVPWLRRDVVAMRREVDALDRALAVPGAPRVDAVGLRLSVLVRPDDIPRLALGGPLARTARAARDGSGCARALAAATRPSEIAAVLRRTPDATAVAALAHGADVVRAWWGGMRDVAPAIDGNVLLRAGVPAGEGLGRALDAVRDALLDEGPSDRDAQLALALRVARQGGDR